MTSAAWVTGHARIVLHAQLLRVGPTPGPQFDAVRAGNDERTTGLHPRCLALDGVDVQRVLPVVEEIAEIAVVQRRRWRITEIPGNAVHARRRRENRRRREPVLGDVRPDRVGWRRDAREFPNQVIGTVVDRERDGSVRGRLQVVVEDRALGRVVANRHFGRKRRVLDVVPPHSIGCLRPEQICGRATASYRLHLPQWCEIIEDPQRTPVRREWRDRYRGHRCRRPRCWGGSAAAVANDHHDRTTPTSPSPCPRTEHWPSRDPRARLGQRYFAAGR